MKVKEFQIEESKINRGMMILIAVSETGDKFVVGGNTDYCTALTPYNQCYNTQSDVNKSPNVPNFDPEEDWEQKIM